MNKISTKKRSKIYSLLLSAITPGLGHLYNGKFIWAITIPIIFIIISDILYYSSLLKSFTFLFLFVVFTIFVYIFSIVHSIILAKQNSNYRLKNFNNILIYLLWPIFFFGINSLLPVNNHIKSFNIPTNGMANTLKINDKVMADMDYKNAEIKRNDIIIFSDPESTQKLMVKRAIAFEGEKIFILNGKIFIDGKEYNEDNPDIIYENNSSDDINEMTIPKGHIFVLGDNRPNSLDSRHFGSIPEASIKGKPLYIFFSDSFDRIGINLQ